MTLLRKSILVLMIVVGLAAIGSLFVNRLRYSHQELKSCFNDAGGLQPGASVRIAGVDVGTVRNVRANPQNQNCPAEVEMALATTYEIRVPRDSIAGINTAGLLGAVYVNIDTSQASGTTVENYGYLRSKPTKPPLSFGEQLKAADVLLHLVQAAKEAEKEIPKDGAPFSSPTKPLDSTLWPSLGFFSRKPLRFDRSNTMPGGHTLVTVLPCALRAKIGAEQP